MYVCSICELSRDISPCFSVRLLLLLEIHALFFNLSKSFDFNLPIKVSNAEWCGANVTSETVVSSKYMWSYVLKMYALMALPEFKENSLDQTSQVLHDERPKT